MIEKERLRVVAAFIRDSSRMLLCKRRANDRYGNFWEFPGGVVEENESDNQAIVREIQEELGVLVEPVGEVSRFYDEDSTLIIDLFLIECVLKNQEPQALECQAFSFEPEEIAELELAPVDRKIVAFLRQNNFFS